MRLFIAICLLWLSAVRVSAEDVFVAVAANFLTTAEQIGAAFEESTGHKAILIHAATGVLATQIRNGAPFDVFLAADSARPAALDADGLGGTPFTYATGRLVLVQRRENARADMDAVLADLDTRLAIANPATAPYGVAAREVLETARGRLNWDRSVVLGENVGQAFAFFMTGNVPAALIAGSQVMDLDEDVVAMPVPASLHAPIRQDGMVLAHGMENAPALAFAAFVQSETGQAIIAKAGYEMTQ